MANSQIKRVLIYRLGSLGDTVVALPSFHLVARAFPDAERCLLTNFPVDPRAPSAKSVLEDSGLVHSYVPYPRGVRAPQQLKELATKIRRWKPDLLVYLAEPRGFKSLIRDVLFFKLCGIAKVIGVPWHKAERQHSWMLAEGFYEPEAARLGRCLRVLGNVQLKDPSNWSLALGDIVRERADEILETSHFPAPFIICSIGTKVEVKDWGGPNWTCLLRRLDREFHTLGLIMLGSAEEAHASDEVAAQWHGPVLNLCGKLKPREAAAVIDRGLSFLGHDSGPMHLAAASGLPCTAVFSARSLPRIWFPYGEGHNIIYHRTACAGCGLEQCLEFAKHCIRSISVEEVYDAAAATIRSAFSKRVAAE